MEQNANDDNKISVIIPTYNRANRIVKCLDSIIKQQPAVYEIIIIDDCSTDNTSDIIKEYKNKHTNHNIVYEKNEKKSGAQVARNKGIDLAHGKWICFCDSDDEWLDNKIKLQLEVLQEHNFDEYIVIHGDCEVNNTVKNARYIWHLLRVNGRDCYNTLLQWPGPMFQAMLTSKKALLSVGKLGEDIKSYQEWDTSLRLAQKCEFIHLETPLFVYNLHGEEQISDDVEKDFNGYEYIIDKYKKDIISICGVSAWNRHIISLIQRSLGERKDFIAHYANKLKLKNLSNSKKYILFGCGQDATWIDMALRSVGLEIVGYIDNYIKKFNGINVYKLGELDLKENEIIFIATEKYQKDIVEQLNDAGYREGTDYLKYTDVFS